MKHEDPIYVDWGDHTEMVDPMRHERWITDNETLQMHQNAAIRKRKFEQIEYEATKQLLEAQEYPRIKRFVPNNASLNFPGGFFVKHAQDREKCNLHGLDFPDLRPDQLPVIMQKLRTGMPEENKANVERQMYEHRHYMQSRLFPDKNV